jgi:VWFA-related protein
LRDVKFGFRVFARPRVFFRTTVLTIALGVGLSASVLTLVGGLDAAIAVLISEAELSAQQPRFNERVDVARVMVDARVLDDRGDPVQGLTAEDFAIAIGGKKARVETATWVGERDGGDAAPPARETPQRTAASIVQGRLIVFLFQKDLEPSRIVGLMRMLFKGRKLLQTLSPDDRVAILSFDSHLKIWSDFTNDRERLDRLLAHDLLLARAPAIQASSAPSLVDRLDAETARRTYGIERALELIGAALEPLPGSKSLVLVGHGFGRFDRGGVAMENEYGAARRALVASRTSVFSLDVTDADYHSLEAGLQIVAEETGGFYARTHVFPTTAMRQLSGALAGYYILFIERPESGRGVRDLEVLLTRRKGRVFATSTYLEHD